MTRSKVKMTLGQAVAYLMTGEGGDDTGYAAHLRLALEGREPRMSGDDAEALLLGLLESGEIVATGRPCRAIGPGVAYDTGRGAEIPDTDWTHGRRHVHWDDSFVEMEGSIPGQGWRDVLVPCAGVEPLVPAAERPTVSAGALRAWLENHGDGLPEPEAWQRARAELGCRISRQELRRLRDELGQKLPRGRRAPVT